MLGPLPFNLNVSYRSNQVNENAQIIQYADDCLLYYSDSESEIALNRLGENLVKLKYYFYFNRLNLNKSKTKFLTFCRKTDKRLQNWETIVVGSCRIQKPNQCKYVNVTIDKHLGFQTAAKKLSKKRAVGIKTIENMATYVFSNSSFHAFLSSCVQSSRKLCCVSAANYLNVFTIIRETDELGCELSWTSFQYQGFIWIEDT